MNLMTQVYSSVNVSLYWAKEGKLVPKNFWLFNHLYTY